MGNGIGKLTVCFAGNPGDISRRRLHDIAVYVSGTIDEGLGYSFCYVDPAMNFSDDPTTSPATFRTISGASISANASTTALVDIGKISALDKASAFKSSDLFSSIPLQPIPRNSVSSSSSGPIGNSSIPGPRSSISSVRSGPIPRLSSSGPIEGGFLSGSLKKSLTSGPLENKPKKWGLFNSFKKVLSRSFSGSRVLSWPMKTDNNNSNNNSNRLVEGDDEAEDVQWAHGKAGEDRVHIVISEEHGFVFVGIYDGFNGPDATDFLLSNLYSNVYKELKGILWHDKSDVPENSVSDESSHSSSYNESNSDVLKALSEGLRKTEKSYMERADMMAMENPELALMGSCVLVMLMKGDDVYLMNVGDSRAVLARRVESDPGVVKEACLDDLEAAFDGDVFNCQENLTSCQLTMDHSTSVKEEVERIKLEHPDDASAVVNDRVKGSLNITRAFGAGFLKQPKWNDALLPRFRIDYVGASPYITCCPSLYHCRIGARDKFLILSSDGLYQYFTNEEVVFQVEMFMSTFPEGDPAQHLVEEVLFRAANKAGMDFHELLDIPQGDRRKYHDDVSIIIISFEGRIWRSFV